MQGELTEAIEGKARGLATAFRGIFEWQWDGRLKTVLAEFPIDRKTEILGILEEHLVCKWDSSNVNEAPDAVREIVGMLGGLMSGQLLLLSDPEKPAFLFCAWWPWGNGQKISIRIGLFSEAKEEKEALIPVLKDQFDL